MKIGQFPPWEIESNTQIEKMLGDRASYWKKGLTCESQSYGIGAFGYYRRIVEEIIGELLDDIAGLMTGEELARYQAALEQTKKTIVAQEKINLVKDLLPSVLRPEELNPLATLHSALSEGLHAKSDEECLEQAETIRQILTFLIEQVELNKAAKKQFTSGMRKLLDKKALKNLSDSTLCHLKTAALMAMSLEAGLWARDWN